MKLCLGRVSNRFIAIALFTYEGAPTATQAVSKNPLKALLKTWAEVRNIRLYNPQADQLPKYTKANRILSALQLSEISIGSWFRKNPGSTDGLHHFLVRDQNHHIAYFTKETL